MDQDQLKRSTRVTNVDGWIKSSLGGVRPVALLQKGWTAYRGFAVPLVIVVRPPDNDWTLRSVAYSLQDGCLASICTSYNEDSETKLWCLTAGSCRNGVWVCHVSRFVKQRVTDRFDPPKHAIFADTHFLTNTACAALTRFLLQVLVS